MIRKLVLTPNYSFLRKVKITNQQLVQFSSDSSWKGKLGLNYYKLNKLEKKHLENPTPASQLEYFTHLAKVNPNQTVEEIALAWEQRKLPFTEEYCKIFFTAVQEGKLADKVDYNQFCEMRNKHLAGNTDAVSTGSILLPVARSPIIPGSSDTMPLFVRDVRREKTFGDQVVSLLKYSITIFIVVALVGTFLDDKGGAGGIGSRLMGSAVHQVEKSEKTFEDVVGIDEAKTELQEIVMYLKDPKKFTRLGGRLPKGILLTGPPGTGKTLLARAIAGEAKVPFFHASGSEFEEMYVGVGAKRVRELFTTAKAQSPCIIFIDEIDAIGGSRHLKDQSAMKMTLNQLLVEMDGFQQNNGVIVIAATNFADSLDSALVRPGRFDKHVDVPMPDIGGRRAILQLYCKKVPMDNDVDLEQLARGTPGFSGAELFNLVNTAALKASVDGLKSVTMHSLEYAKDKILMGAERKSAIISPETLKLTAFHEAGHALVALKTKGADPIHKATIMPRGRALGMVMQLPDGDQTSMSRQQMLARLDVCMGGRVAEEVVFGPDNVTSGASSDIQQATRLARAMVTKYGLSSKVGIQFFDEKQHLSPHQQEEIDNEVKIILEQSYARAKKVLQDNAKELELLATGLMEYESLSGSEVVDLINGRKISQVKRSQKPSRTLQALAPLSETVGTKEEKDKPVEHLANEKNSTNNNSSTQVAPAAPAAPAHQTKSESSNTTSPPAAQSSQPKAATRGPPK